MGLFLCGHSVDPTQLCKRPSVLSHLLASTTLSGHDITLGLLFSVLLGHPFSTVY